MVPFPTTYAPLSLDWRAPKTQIAIISRTGKFTDLILADTLTVYMRMKPH